MLNIPEDKLPPEFKDEARLDSLYSPFRSHSVNPRDRDTKISKWKTLISLYCINNSIYAFSLNKLNKVFIHHGRPPKCLHTVLEELLKENELQYVEHFLKEDTQSWSSWAADLLVKKPLSWSYNTVKDSLFVKTLDPDKVCVHLGVVVPESEKLFTSFPDSKRNQVLRFPEFLQLVGRDVSQGEDLKILLHYLVKEKKADTRGITNSAKIESLLVKVGYQGKPVQISEVDLAVFHLEENEKVFTKCIENLEDEIAKCLKDVKSHLAKGHRQLAKTCLKKKHEIQKRLDHKTNSLHNIQVLLERIKDAHQDAAVWQSYKHALKAFNATVKETGLTEDAVEDTMEELGEMLDIQQDINAAISKHVIEDEDFEEELAELMKTEEKVENQDELDELLAKLDLSKLPKVPVGEVSVPEAT